MIIKSQKLIEYFGTDDTDLIKESYLRIIDLNIIGVEDFEEIGQILNILESRSGMVVIPSFSDNTILREFIRHFEGSTFRGKDFLKSVFVYTRDDKDLEGCSDDELEMISSVISASGETQRQFRNFIDIDGLRNLDVAEHISDEALVFLAKATNILNFSDDTFAARLKELMESDQELAAQCMVLEESKEAFNKEKTIHTEFVSDLEKIQIGYVTAEELDEIIKSGAIDKVKIRGIVVEKDYKMPDGLLGAIYTAGIQDIFIKDENGISEIKKVDELVANAEILLSNNEDFHSIYLDLSQYSEIELVFIAKIIEENFSSTSGYPGEIHLICDSGTMGKLNVVLENIDPKTQNVIDYNLYDFLSVDARYSGTSESAEHYESFDRVKKVNIGTGATKPDKKVSFPNAVIENKGIRMGELTDFYDIDGLTLSKMLDFASVISTETPRMAALLKRVAEKKGIDFFVSKKGIDFLVSESDILFNFTRCEATKDLPWAGFTEEEYEYLKQEKKLKNFNFVSVGDEASVTFVNEQCQRLFKIGSSFNEEADINVAKTIAFCDKSGNVEEIPAQKYKAIREKIERYFGGKENPLINYSPVIDLSYFTEEELKYVGIFLRQEADFGVDSKYIRQSIVVLDDKDHLEKAGILINALKSEGVDGDRLLSQMYLATDDPVRLLESIKQVTGDTFGGFFITDAFENLLSDERRSLLTESAFLYADTALKDSTVEVENLTKEGMYLLLKYGNNIRSLKGLDMDLVFEVVDEHPELTDRLIMLQNGEIVNGQNFYELFMGGYSGSVALDNIDLLDYFRLRDLKVLDGRAVGTRISIKTDHPEELTDEFLDGIDREQIRIVVTPENLEKVINSPLYKNHPDRILFQIRNINDISLDQVRFLQSLGLKDIQVYDTTTEEHQNKPYEIDKFYHIKSHMDELISEIPEGLSELEKAAIIYFRVATSYTYDDDACDKTTSDKEYCERVTDSSRNLENACIHGKTVCAGYAEVLRCALMAAGIEAEYVRCECPDDSAHAYVRAKIDGVWYNLDPTWDNPNLSMIRRQDGIHISGFPRHFLVADQDLDKSKINRRGRECTEKFPEMEVRRVFRALYDGRLGPVMRVQSKDEDMLLVAKKNGQSGAIHTPRLIFDGVDPDGIYESKKDIDIEDIDKAKPDEEPTESTPDQTTNDSDENAAPGNKLSSSKIPKTELDEIGEKVGFVSNTNTVEKEEAIDNSFFGRIKRIIQGMITRKNQKAIDEPKPNYVDDETKQEDNNPWKVDGIDINNNYKEDEIPKIINDYDKNKKPKGDDSREE